jgi:hypothetical protein
MMVWKKMTRGIGPKRLLDGDESLTHTQNGYTHIYADKRPSFTPTAQLLCTYIARGWVFYVDLSWYNGSIRRPTTWTSRHAWLQCHPSIDTRSPPATAEAAHGLSVSQAMSSRKILPSRYHQTTGRYYRADSIAALCPHLGD